MARDKVVRSMGREERQFKVQHGLHVLREADEMKKDKGLMRDIKKEASAQVRTLKKIAK